MFFITCFEKCEKDVVTGMPDVGDTRTVKYYEDLEICKRALHENRCDIHEFLYEYAVVEYIEPGIYSRAKEIEWFQWDNEKGGFFEILKPQCTYGCCNYALG